MYSFQQALFCVWFLTMWLLHQLFLCVFFQLAVSSTCNTKNGCNCVLHEGSGTFSTTNDLANEEICTWTILAKEDENIMLKITDIDIKKSPNCTSGYVEVRDGDSTNSPIIGRFCGTGSLATVNSTTDRMLITYFHLKPNKGFKAQYKAISCGGDIFLKDSFILVSHSSSDSYSRTRKCVWQVIVPEKHQVVLNFQRFELEDYVDCLSDYVEILDGSTLNSTTFGKFCGTETPPEIVSSFNTLLITFVSNAGSIPKKGFSAIITNEYDECSTPFHGCAHGCVNTVGDYTCTCRDGYDLRIDGKTCELGCGGVTNDPRGTIQSPSFPQRYPKNKTCTWEIQSTSGYLIVLNFTHFDIEGGNGNSSNMKKRCVKDKLEIRNVFSGSGSSRVGFYCGNDLPDGVISESNKMQIIFSSDVDVEKSGFSMEYYTVRDTCADYNANCYLGCVTTALKYPKCTCPDGYFLQENGLDCKKDSCQYKIASSVGHIESPYYRSNEEFCEWHFQTTPGHRIVLDFLEYLSNYNCGEEYLAVWDGSYSWVKVCSDNSSISITSTTNEMYLNYDGTGGSEFRARYFTLCGGSLRSTTQHNFIFSHVNYNSSSEYAENANCEWTVASSGYNTSVTFETFDIEQSEDCEYDSVEIWENDSLFGRFCGSSKPLNGSFVFSGILRIRFQSDGDINGGGFKIKYRDVVEDIYL